jgi:hypothetical protein
VDGQKPEHPRYARLSRLFSNALATDFALAMVHAQHGIGVGTERVEPLSSDRLVSIPFWNATKK